MDLLEKICDWVVWILIMGGIIGLFIGTYEVIDLILIGRYHG